MGGEIELTYKILQLHATELAHVLVIVRGLVAVGPRRHGRGVVGVREEEEEQWRAEEQSESRESEVVRTRSEPVGQVSPGPTGPTDTRG